MPPPIVEHTNISQNNQNHPSTWKILIVCQKIEWTLKNWWSIRWYHEYHIYQDAKTPHLKWNASVSEAIKLVPATEKYKTPLIKIKNIWKTIKIKNNLCNIKKWDLHFTISQGAKAPHPRWDTSIPVQSTWKTLKVFQRS